MISGDNAAGITQMRGKCEIELIAMIDFVDGHQRTLQHLARHHCVRSRLGKYETERDGWLFHEEAREVCGKLSHHLIARMSTCHLVSSICAARHLCHAMHKKGAAIALTSLVTLRHNNSVRECEHCERVLAQPMTSE